MELGTRRRAADLAAAAAAGGSSEGSSSASSSGQRQQQRQQDMIKVVVYAQGANLKQAIKMGSLMRKVRLATGVVFRCRRHLCLQLGWWSIAVSRIRLGTLGVSVCALSGGG